MPHGASCRGILAGQPHAGRGVPGGAALLCPAASCRRAATRRRTTHACRVLARASCPRVPPALFRDGGEAYTPADEPNVRGCQPLSAAPGVTPGAPSLQTAQTENLRKLGTTLWSSDTMTIERPTMMMP
jgi:hypothetical protein